MSDAKCYQATPHGTLLEQIMDSTQPKNEREWAAARELERKDADIAELVDGMKRIAKLRIVEVDEILDDYIDLIVKHEPKQDGK